MDAVRGAAAFAAGALVAQYGVRGSGGGRAHALSTTATAVALPPPPSPPSSSPPAPSSSSSRTTTTTSPSLDLDRLAASIGREAWPYVQAAAAVAAAGAVAAAAHAAASALCAAISKRLVFEAEVDSRDDAYRWLMLWLSRHRALAKASRVSVTTSLRAFGTSTDCGLAEVDEEREEEEEAASEDDDDEADDSTATKPPPVALLPAPGVHALWHQGRLFIISRRRAPGNPHSPSNARLLSETLILRTALGKGGRAAVLRLLADARACYAAHTRGSTLVYSVDSSSCYWEAAGSRPHRPLASVVLPGQEDGERLLADARRFLSSGKWYASRGIPHRRGYLLQGPPGSGKSSLVAAMAAELGLSIYSVTLSSPLLTDDGLRSLLNAAGSKGALLLEDVDAAFGSRVAGAGAEGGSSSSSPSSLTLAGLLNALDGVAAQEGRLLFLTTNHPERLDPALVRPGRVDVRVSFAKASRSQLRRMFAHFFSSSESSVEDLAARFADALPEGELSLAEVQGLLLLHRDDPLAAVEAAEAGALRNKEEAGA